MVNNNLIILYTLEHASGDDRQLKACRMIKEKEAASLCSTHLIHTHTPFRYLSECFLFYKTNSSK